MKRLIESLFIAGALSTIGGPDAEAQFNVFFNSGGGNWCAPFDPHIGHHNDFPIFSPWSPAGYLPYHDPFCEPSHRVIVPSIRYTVVPSNRSVIPSAPTVSPTARAASSRPIFTSRRVTNTGELVSAFLAKAKEEFRVGEYNAALYNLDEALELTPNDTGLRQLRALGLFAQARYEEAAGIIKPVNESDTAWNWNTMIAHYPSEDVYERHLRRLEHHINSNPNSPNPRHLLGYHYQIGGYLSEARMMFEQANNTSTAIAKTEPAPFPKPAPVVETEPRPKPKPKPAQPEEVDEAIMAATVAPPAIQPEPAPVASIGGDWRSVTDDGKTITLKIGNDGKFTWEYEGATVDSILSGDWSLGKNGELNLVDKDVPLSGTIVMDGDNTMRFVLDGTPDGDPGLVFERM